MLRPDKVQQLALFVTRFYLTTRGRVVEATANQNYQELMILLSTPDNFSRKFSTTHGSNWNRFELSVLVKVWEEFPQSSPKDSKKTEELKSPPEGGEYVSILGLTMALVCLTEKFHKHFQPSLPWRQMS